MNFNFQNMTRDKNPSETVPMPEYLKGNKRSGKNESGRLIDIYVEGISADAKVIKIDEAGVFTGRVYYRISLEVTPLHHSKKFKTTGFAPVSGSLIPKPGDIINIKYSANDCEKFVIL